MNEDELKALAAQLSKPDGEFGLMLAENMNETNIGMTLHAIDQLNLKQDEQVLEIGHGNCGHLENVLSRAKGITYTGLEISEPMQAEAEKINARLLSEQVTFLLYDGTELPFADNTFDAVYTVNTLYFWKQPADFLKEIYRVLKPGGRFSLTFADKQFMDTLPFTKYGFTLYAMQDTEALIQATSFSDYSCCECEEQVKSKSGDLVNRKFYTFSITK